MTSQGLHRGVVLAGPDDPGGKTRAACLPVPAIVETLPAFRSTARMAWFSVSATKSVSPFRNIPCGRLKRGLLEIAVVEALFAAADRDRVLSIQVGLDDPVMAGIGDEEPFAGGIGEDLARVQQRALGGAFHLGREH